MGSRLRKVVFFLPEMILSWSHHLLFYSSILPQVQTLEKLYTLSSAIFHVFYIFTGKVALKFLGKVLCDIFI